MTKNKILATGYNGYLLSSFKRKFDFIDLKDFKNQKIKYIFHFGSPPGVNSNEELAKLRNSELKTLELIDISNRTNTKLIFASSEGAEHCTNVYEKSKLKQEMWINKYCKNFLILRIPRVYSCTRNYGLIKLLKENKVPICDYNKEVSFITLNKFKEWFLDNLNNTGTIRCNFQVTQKISYIKDVLNYINQLKF